MRDLIQLPQDTGDNEIGIICAANATRFNDAHFSQPLTSYAVGFKDPEDAEAALNNLVGTPISTSHKFEYQNFEDADEFGYDTDDARSIGGEFKRLEYQGSKDMAKLVNRGLTVRLDRDEIEDDPMAEERATGRLIRRIYRNSLIRAAALISAAAINTGKTWDTTAGKDPDQDILSELVTAADITGIRHNNVVYGETAWNKRVLAFRAQNNAAGYASAGLTPEQVAALLMVDKASVIKSRYQGASSKTQVVGDKVWLYTALNGGDIEDPSSIKRFVNGGGVKVYRQEKGVKFIDVTVEHYELIKIVSTLGIRQFTIQ